MEHRFHPPLDPNLSCSRPLGQAVHDSLAPKERIVEDCYQNTNGEAVITVERVTVKPTDMGKNFPHGSCGFARHRCVGGPAGLWDPLYFPWWRFQ